MFHKINLLVLDVGEQEHTLPDSHVGLPQSNVTFVEKSDITVVFVDRRYRQPLFSPRRPDGHNVNRHYVRLQNRFICRQWPISYNSHNSVYFTNSMCGNHYSNNGSDANHYHRHILPNPNPSSSTVSIPYRLNNVNNNIHLNNCFDKYINNFVNNQHHHTSPQSHPTPSQPCIHLSTFSTPPKRS